MDLCVGTLYVCVFGALKGSQLSQKAVPELAEMSLDKTTRQAAGQPFWGMPHWAVIRHCGPADGLRCGPAGCSPA